MLKSIKFKLFTLVSILTIGVSLVSFIPKSLADSGSIYFSSSSYSETSGASFTVNVYVDPGGNSINSVQTDVSYNSSLLQLSSFSPETFTLCAQQSGGGGSVNLGCASGSNYSSTVEVATMTFESLAGSGSTSLSLSGSYAADTSGEVSLSTGSASISFYTPASSPAPTHSSGSSSHSSSKPTSTSSSPTSSPASTTAATPTATVALPSVSIGGLNAKAQLTTASVSVNSSYAAQTLIKYGTTAAAMTSSSSLSAASKSSYTTLSGLAPTTTYYYQAVDYISGQVVATSKVQSFTTKGFTLSVVVLDSKYRPLVNQVVYLHSADLKGTTNDQGVATFYNVPSGVHHLDYTVGNKSYSQTVYVNDNPPVTKGGVQSAATQTQSVVLSGYIAKTTSPVLTILLVLIVLMFIVFVYVIYEVNRAHHHTRLHVEKFVDSLGNKPAQPKV